MAIEGELSTDTSYRDLSWTVWPSMRHLDSESVFICFNLFLSKRVPACQDPREEADLPPLSA